METNAQHAEAVTYIIRRHNELIKSAEKAVYDAGVALIFGDLEEVVEHNDQARFLLNLVDESQAGINKCLI